MGALHISGTSQLCCLNLMSVMNVKQNNKWPMVITPVRQATLFRPLPITASTFLPLRSNSIADSSVLSSKTLRKRCCAGSHGKEVSQDNDNNNESELVVLGIETSCDDTGAAVVRGDGRILSQALSSQSNLLVEYGGVAPKMAQGAHAKVIDEIVTKALTNANVKASDLTAVAVTIGPGLSLCLDVGVRKARQIARRNRLPIVGVHHMEAHALVARLTEKDLQFPFLALLISGGHNLLVLAQGVGQYLQLGTTLDDAIGEAYDKVARWLGLNMNRGGGPAVEELAQEGDPYSIKFSVPMQQHKDCNFSFAGLKTQGRLAIASRTIDAGKVTINDVGIKERQLRADIAASFQRVAVLHLEQRCDRAIKWAQRIEPNIKCLVLSGGVASNKYVRAQLDRVAKKNNLNIVLPPPSLCTDNGAMVAWTGIEHFRLGRWEAPPSIDEPEDAWVDLRPRWQLGEIYSNPEATSRPLERARVHPSLTSAFQKQTSKSSMNTNSF
eukprot:TRINITY_DN2645_c0_g1_i1.p1 TRINITY_DN2645_c0_g1~~TRINITY_DN2645_c0_g1_i1.p1  ORF type:complete len:497 (-),score=91.07 TRINITY_DN2645_c0_g1_i1:164-1654(-)